jgi:ferredoxin
MGPIKYIKGDDIPELLDNLNREYRVLVPVKEGGVYLFRPFDGKKTIQIEYQATAPPKDAIFPQTETLIRFIYHKDLEDLTKTEIELQENIVSHKQIVFGSRPCDARGFTIYDRVYINQRFPDPYYKTRRENTLFVSIVCTRPENTCFCTSVGSHPADPSGSDILLFPVDGGYLAQAISERGMALMGTKGFSDAEGREKEIDRVREEAISRMGRGKDLTGAKDKILQLFDNLSFWEGVSAKCISCGACTYLCPTCYCFNITDESYGLTGERIRTWDTCMSFLFTLEGSGHNPRPTKAHRLRNRVGHKFSYYPAIHDGIVACCGCGRCIKSCPVSVDIREIVLKAKEFRNDDPSKSLSS